LPETYGLPEQDEPYFTRDSIERAFNEAVAGQGVVRRVVLYGAVGLFTVLGWGPVAILALLLLMATDKGLL
jgi:hypothetical protein